VLGVGIAHCYIKHGGAGDNVGLWLILALGERILSARALRATFWDVWGPGRTHPRTYNPRPIPIKAMNKNGIFFVFRHKEIRAQGKTLEEP